MLPLSISRNKFLKIRFDRKKIKVLVSKLPLNFSGIWKCLLGCLDGPLLLVSSDVVARPWVTDLVATWFCFSRFYSEPIGGIKIRMVPTCRASLRLPLGTFKSIGHRCRSSEKSLSRFLNWFFGDFSVKIALITARFSQ